MTYLPQQVVSELGSTRQVFISGTKSHQVEDGKQSCSLHLWLSKGLFIVDGNE